MKRTLCGLSLEEKKKKKKGPASSEKAWEDRGQTG